MAAVVFKSPVAVTKLIGAVANKVNPVDKCVAFAL